MAALVWYALPMNTRCLFWASAVAAVFLLSCSFARYPGATGPSRLQIEQKSHAVRIEKTCYNAFRNATSKSMGSGVLLDSKTVITADHVTAEHPFLCLGPIYKVITANGTSLRVDKVKSVPGLDVAFVTLRAEVPFITEISFARVKEGDRVCLEALAPKRGRSCGDVTKVDGFGFMHDAWVVPGNSGSGIYNAFGQLVGIVSTCKWNGFIGECIGGGGAVSLWGIESRMKDEAKSN